MNTVESTAVRWDDTDMLMVLWQDMPGAAIRDMFLGYGGGIATSSVSAPFRDLSKTSLLDRILASRFLNREEQQKI